jgi:hypothetical protein
VVLALLFAPAVVAAQGTSGSTGAKTSAGALTGSPAIKEARARKIADAVDSVQTQQRKHPGFTARAFMNPHGQWQVSYFSQDKPPKEIAQVIIDPNTGGVLEAWTGDQVAWTMARGYPGAFGRKVNSPWVWITLTILFVAPFCAGRPRMLHLDLAALAAFGVSVAYFNDAQIDKSVPIAYVLLAYLFVRAIWIGLHRDDEHKRPLPLPTLVPVAWLAIALIFLVGFRIGLNVTNSNVIDVGYASVIGADKIAKGQPIYKHFPADNPQGDTYGPVAYESYVPFEQALPWNGAGWEDLNAAHAAAIVFDLICMALLLLIGWRTRGPSMGIVLAYLWAAFPFTLYAMNTASNDALVAVFALAALAATTAPGRGAFAALGGLTKFGSLALAPLLALQDRRPRHVASFVLAFAGVAAIASLPIFIEHESLRTVYDRTISYQATRESPFSIWGRYDLDLEQTFWQGLSIVFALVVAVVPRRRDVVGLAALMAAILIGLQLGVSHWFYLYIPWFFGLYVVAVFGRHAAPEGRLL